MKVNITISRPLKPYGFAEILLSYSNPEPIEASLTIDYKNLYMFTKKQSGIAFDLFLTACVVYGIDILLPREKIGFNAWSREIEVTIPLENMDVFEAKKSLLEESLNFLTGDIWSLSFTNAPGFRFYKTGKRQKCYKDSYRNQFKIVNLFSGGMDSLIGAIDQLSTSDEQVCLVSHTDSVFKGAKKDQEMVLDVINSKYHHFYHIPTRVDMSDYDVNGAKYPKETTLRSRSFLFLSMGVLVADSIDSLMPVYIPENGTISLNLPLTPSRRCTCSTRTTHPHFFHLLELFLQSIGMNHSIVNKYQLCTKGEMVENCADRDMLLKTYSLSCSCGKRGTRKDIRDNKYAHHCGVCMPCIYRRAALHKIGESETVGTDIFNSRKRKFMEIPDMPALVSYLRKNYSVYDIEGILLENGSLPLDKLGQYASVVMRTRDEIKQWVRDNASDEIKNQFGI